MIGGLAEEVGTPRERDSSAQATRRLLASTQDA
jgi:hypothetical protein